MITGEVAAVIKRLQFHPIVIDHAVGGDASLGMIEDQIQGELLAIQPLKFLGSAAPTLHRHVVLPPNGVQVGEVCDDRGLLAAEGQVDKIFYIGDAQFAGHPLELSGLTVVKTVQPLGQVVQFIEVKICFLQTL